MKAQVLLLVHGMGDNTPPAKNGNVGSFGKEFIDTTNGVLQQFAKHMGKSIEDYFDVYEFNFNGWFDQMRKQMAKTATDMQTRLAGVAGIYGASVPLQLASKLTGLEAKFGGDSFFYTHWLDVIFYAEMLGEEVRVDAAHAIASLVTLYGAGNVHIIAHSLGTAVMHDTLYKVYRPESDPNDKIPDLDPQSAGLGSIWMIANVSRLLDSVTQISDPLRSVVNPGPTGCVSFFGNVRHELDPFTWLARFDPANDGKWIPENVYPTHYDNVVTSLIVQGNTHSFSGYLSDPAAWKPLFEYLLDDKFQATPAEIDKAQKDYAAKSLNGAYAALQAELKGLSQDDHPTDWFAFLESAKRFKDAVEHIKDTF